MVRSIIIKPVLNGFICKVGCQSIVFKTVEEMTTHITRYYNSKGKYEEEFLADHTVNNVGTPTDDVQNERPTETDYPGRISVNR